MLLKRGNIKIIFFKVFLTLGILVFVFVLCHDLIAGEKTSIGIYDRTALIVSVTVIFVSLNLLLFYKFRLYQKKFFSTKIFLFEGIMAVLLIILLVIAGGSAYRRLLTARETSIWSIGIYYCFSSEPIEFSGQGICNPILTAEDITDIEAKFVADPFLIHEKGVFYLFFEVFNSRTRQGDIGLATSQDGLNWNYRQIVPDESYHLSFPYVFRYNNEFYMMPAKGDGFILYRADPFPTHWVEVKTIIQEGGLGDGAIFYFRDSWWILAGAEGRENLELFYADTPLGPWVKHPKSPVVKGNADWASPGGQVVVFDDRVIRYAQDVTPYYGNQVWAIEITKLTKDDYEEKMARTTPILKGDENWNTRGMHHISPVRLEKERWLAAVDGY